MLPVSEILFVEDEPGYWPIVTYDAKWRPDSRDYRATPADYPAKELGSLFRQRWHAELDLLTLILLSPFQGGCLLLPDPGRVRGGGNSPVA